MEQEHRDKILNNIDRLMRYTSYENLMEACLKYQLLYAEMQENIETKYPSKNERHKHLIEKITHRGPEAYALFENILKEIFPDAAEILSHTSYRNATFVREISIRENRQLMYGDANRSPTQETPPANNNFIGNSSAASSIPTPMPSAVGSATPQQDIPQTSQSTRSVSVSSRIELTEYTEEVFPNMHINVKLSDRIHGDPIAKISTYPMKGRDRGVFILVNNIHFRNKNRRNGAEVDRDNLVTLFRQMGFKILLYEDLCKDDFVELIKNLSLWSELRKYDCFVFALLSHGDGNEMGLSVEFSDRGFVDVEDILTQFNNLHCKHLVGKPKIFLFPFCRGRLSDSGTVNTESDSARNAELDAARTNIPTFHDMKICYSTIPGYNAFRDPKAGSWYIAAMCQVFSDNAHDTHLEDLLKLVGTRVSIMRTEHSELQTPSNEDRGFNKTLYFNPGYYQNP